MPAISGARVYREKPLSRKEDGAKHRRACSYINRISMEVMQMADIERGQIKMFNGTFGFIFPEAGGGDVFFPVALCKYYELPMLYTGDRVIFTRRMTEAGREAADWMQIADAAVAANPHSAPAHDDANRRIS